mmetsp:Transcript_16398/g.34272  ORF Transcript_16398/g.34272 Transcript_16398/m.34272 type:complete len:111 (-) Transcript_16398:6-338(-)
MTTALPCAGARFEPRRLARKVAAATTPAMEKTPDVPLADAAWLAAGAADRDTSKVLDLICGSCALGTTKAEPSMARVKLQITAKQAEDRINQETPPKWGLAWHRAEPMPT